MGEQGEPATANQGTSYLINGKTYFAPVVVKQADMYMEGGTLSLLITDARGKELWACNDGRGCLNCKDTPMRHPIYIGGYHLIAKTAKPLPLGGADERELYRMLKAWFGEAEKRGGPKLGVPEAVRRDILGHSPGTMTASYTHSYQEARERAVELVSDYGEARTGEDCVKNAERPTLWLASRTA